jgi:hypothetical protein
MGGKAFEGITRRILKEEIKPTLNWLTANWSGSKIQGGDYIDHLLGSAGKNIDSGDLDLNMNIELYNQEEVANALTTLLGEDHVKPRPGNNQIFTAVPIRGNEKHGYVQVDFMFGNYAWQAFSYYSPSMPIKPAHWWHLGSGESNFKGLYRTELIKALVAFNSDWVLEENEEVIARVGPTFFHDRGIVWRYRHRPMRKDGKGRVKDFAELAKDDFLAIYPSALTASATVIDNPKEVEEFIFRGNYFRNSDLDSLEAIWYSVTRCFSVQEVATIKKIYLERLNSLKAEIPVDKFRKMGLRV